MMNEAHVNSDVDLAPNSLHHTIGPKGAAAFSHLHDGYLSSPIDQSDVTGLVTALGGKSATGHGHDESDITALVADLASRIKNPGVNNVLETTGVTTATTSAAGIITITHGLGVVVVVANANVQGAATQNYCTISNLGATTFDVTVWHPGTGAVVSSSRVIHWRAAGV